MEHYECACALRRAKELEEQAAAAGCSSPLARAPCDRVRVRLRVPCCVDLLLPAEEAERLDRAAMLEMVDRALRRVHDAVCGRMQQKGRANVPVDVQVGPVERVVLDRLMVLESVTAEKR